jgi:hypothetical protein
MDILKYQRLGTHNFTNPMIPLNVLGSRVETWILGKMDVTLAIAKQILILMLHAKRYKKIFIHNTSLQASIATMYSSSTVHNETHFSNLN